MHSMWLLKNYNYSSKTATTSLFKIQFNIVCSLETQIACLWSEELYVNGGLVNNAADTASLEHMEANPR